LNGPTTGVEVRMKIQRADERRLSPFSPARGSLYDRHTSVAENDGDRFRLDNVSMAE
jgi:hypothetical protein